MSPVPSTIYHPTSELVAAAWIAQVAGINPAGVATSCPHAEQWPKDADGISHFITVKVVGGNPHPTSTIPIAEPEVEVRVRATKLLSNKPAWGAANQQCEVIRYATYNRQLGTFGKALVISTNDAVYAGARVLRSRIDQEPRKLFGDPKNWAVFQFDMYFCWSEIGLVIP